MCRPSHSCVFRVGSGEADSIRPLHRELVDRVFVCVRVCTLRFMHYRTALWLKGRARRIVCVRALE